MRLGLRLSVIGCTLLASRASAQEPWLDAGAPLDAAVVPAPDAYVAEDAAWLAEEEPVIATAITPANEAEPELGTVVVTGVRGAQVRTVADTPSPVDVIGHQEVQATGRTGLKEILGAIVPAMSMPQLAGGGTSASVKPYSYRGLSGDYLLVLVNGKRRHTTALINNLSRISGGSTPVDFDLIPASAISRIEILRDGAAAQYGSDAISGVLNIILDDSPEGLNAQLTSGRYYEKGGNMVQLQASQGLKLGNKGGFARLSLDLRFRDRAKSSADPLPDTKPNGAPNYYYAPIDVNTPDPREAGVQDKVFAGGYGRSNQDYVATGAYNAELPLTAHAKLYSFSTLSYRYIDDARGAFPANHLGALPEKYPNGFQAYRRISEWDGQAGVGAKGDFRDWTWDLSTGWGRDYVWLGARNVLNPSLGPASKSRFFMGKQVQDLVVNNLDLSKGFDIGLADKLQLSFGFEHRYEKFQNREGEADSYRDGGYVVPIGADPWHQAPLPMGVGGYGGLAPSPGLVSFTGTSPADARNKDRNNYAAYAELSTRPWKPWYLGIAGRAEHYDDSAGNVASGKFVTRYDIWKGIGIRGGVNTGFRAPSLAQSAFSTTQNTITIIGADRVSTTSKFLPVDSQAARALGASDLKPEKSVSVTAGVTFEPSRIFRLTLDFYQTQIRDRIVKTDFIGTSNNGGAAVGQLLASQGVTDVDSAQYFANAIDTTTRGLDLVSELTLRSARAGTFRPSVAFNFAATEIDKIAANPSQLANLNVVRFGRQGQIDIKRGAPRNKLILAGNYQLGRVRADLRVTRYGEYIEASTTAGADVTFSGKWITDLDVAVNLTDSLSLAVGAYNLFDVYPDHKGALSQTEGSGGYGAFSPFGLSGGFYYARLGLTL
ncbi:MAG: TonB-dependent receptor [Polyangiales bacterium]